MMINKKPVTLFYDLETSPLKAWFWQPGQQYVGHKNMIHGHDMWDIICIQYAIDDGPVKVLRYDKHGGTKGMLEKFDIIAEKADIIIGKNNKRFDDKMINSLRMFNGLKGQPQWTLCSDDLEQHMRKHFRLPSQSLDYISKKLGVGGKIGMEMGDWIAISNYREATTLGINNKLCQGLYGMSLGEVKKIGKTALEKMCTYGAKDTDDTRKIWYYLVEHFEPKFNMSTWSQNGLSCKRCGSDDLNKTGPRPSPQATTMVQGFNCKSCQRYAGKATLLASGNYGKMR